MQTKDDISTHFPTDIKDEVASMKGPDLTNIEQICGRFFIYFVELDCKNRLDEYDVVSRDPERNWPLSKHCSGKRLFPSCRAKRLSSVLIYESFQWLKDSNCIRFSLDPEHYTYYIIIETKKNKALTSTKLIILLNKNLPDAIKQKLGAGIGATAKDRCIELGFGAANDFNTCAPYSQFQKNFKLD